MSAHSITSDVLVTFRAQKLLAERAVEQLTDDHLHTSLDKNTNSVAVIMKHMAGNMRSRWTEFLTTDGEKAWRNRDDEFVDTIASRDELMEVWEAGWCCLIEALEPLKSEDLSREILIRGEPLTVMRAILRQVDHYGYHVGQIVMIARILSGDQWVTLTIPRGKSIEYNQRVWKTN